MKNTIQKQLEELNQMREQRQKRRSEKLIEDNKRADIIDQKYEEEKQRIDREFESEVEKMKAQNTSLSQHNKVKSE